MPIYIKSLRTRYFNTSLLKNLSTLKRPVSVDNLRVNYFVNQCFFRHLDQLCRIMGMVFAVVPAIITNFNTE